MARLMALCSLPRTNPGNRLQYVRCNGPYTLVMSATGLHKLPFGNLPRLLLTWCCTEAVRTQSRELVLGTSLPEFMRTLGMAPIGGWNVVATAFSGSGVERASSKRSLFCLRYWTQQDFLRRLLGILRCRHGFCYYDR